MKMILDIRTLSFALGLTFFIQSIAFFVLSQVIKKIPGVQFWGWGSIALMLGFLSMYFRSFGRFESHLILFGNLIQFSGLVLLFIGSNRFIGFRRKNIYVYIFLLINLLFITYFTYIDNQLKARIIIYSLTLSVLLFYNGWILISHKNIFFRKSSIFVAVIFFLLALFFIVRFFYVMIFSTIDDFYSPDKMQVATFIMSISIGLLWTFGLIIMVTQKMNYELLITSEQLKAINSEKDKFFSIIAHDLRGPFASIINLSEVISEDFERLGQEQKKIIAQSLYTTALSTNELLEDLLEWSGASRGIKAFHPVEIDFHELMNQTINSLNYSAHNKQITIDVMVPEKTQVFVDPHMFQTIFRNLIINSIKFTNEGGLIVIRLDRDGAEEQVFSVTDNGIGMSKILLDSLFKIGQRSNRQGTKGEISSGLGLLICKEFVEKHGGTIWAESEEGKGSTFLFSVKRR